METLNDQVLANTRRIFETCDLNGDGLLDRVEFHVLLEALDEDTSLEESLLNFEAVDRAGVGYIEFKEFVTWWTN